MTTPYNPFIKPALGTPIQRGHPLARGLIGAWLFNEGGGIRVHDLSGHHGTDGTIITSLDWVAGNTGPALYYNGVGYVRLWRESVTSLSQFSICGHFQVKAAHETSRLYIEYNAKVDISIARASNDLHITALRDYDTTNATASSSNFFLTGYNSNFIHFVCVFDNGTWTIYIDGEDDTQSGVPGVGSMVGQGGDSARWRIGDSYFGTTEHDGNIETFSIYNRALSALEAAELYRTPYIMYARNPIELWAAEGGGAPGQSVVPIINILNRRRRA